MPSNMNVFNRPGPKRVSTSSSLAPRRSCRPSLFNAIRGGVYIGILLWTVVVLAIAVHFLGLLVSSDLTRFVPFAIFVSAASLLIILVLLGTTLLKQRNPVSTRFELASLGLLGVFWLALGSFLLASEAGEADVECFSADSTEDDPVDFPGFSTETFHAQYRVLEAFSLFNLILVLGFLLFLLFLALREHRRGYTKVWLYPSPTYPWFGKKDNSPYKRNNSTRKVGLPAPVTARDGRRKDSGRRPSDKAVGKQPTENRRSQFWVWVDKPRHLPEAHTRDRRRQASGRTQLPGPSGPSRRL